ncbi:hypothetical protein XENTR_v10017729 [Xenopus tropicalis]|nr:hypothetical protein XENTR_v10017729 [Xenopus tropicalis]
MLCDLLPMNLNVNPHIYEIQLVPVCNCKYSMETLVLFLLHFMVSQNTYWYFCLCSKQVNAQMFINSSGKMKQR